MDSTFAFVMAYILLTYWGLANSVYFYEDSVTKLRPMNNGQAVLLLIVKTIQSVVEGIVLYLILPVYIGVWCFWTISSIMSLVITWHFLSVRHLDPNTLIVDK